MSRESKAMATSPLPSGKDVSGEKKSGEKIEGKAESENRSNPLLVRRGLSFEQKAFIIESFACFQTHSAVQQEFAKRFGTVLDIRTLASYDPQHRFCRIGPRLRSLYAQCRAAYVDGVKDVAISHQAHRLRLVGRIVEKATTSKDYAAALKGLELAAKEMGGALASVHTVRHEGQIAHVHATVEEARREVAARLAQVIEGGTLLPMPMATPPATEGEGGA